MTRLPPLLRIALSKVEYHFGQQREADAIAEAVLAGTMRDVDAMSQTITLCVRLVKESAARPKPCLAP